MHQVRAISLASYVDVANFVGLDGLKLLAASGISPHKLEDPEARLPALALTKLLEQSAELSGCQSFGIRMAACRSFASLGPIALLLERLANIGEVVEALSARRRTLNDVLVISFFKEEGTAFVRFALDPAYCRTQAMDLTVGLGFLTLAGASQDRWRPEAVHLTRSKPRDTKLFERFFQAPLVFESYFDGLSFPEEDLEIELPNAHPVMANNAKRLLNLIQLPEVKAPVSDHVRNSIALLLPGGQANLQSVARNLGLTPRVLQRELQAERQSFGSLLDEVRRDLAQRYVRCSSMSMTDIAHALGYSAPGSFTRWFDGQFGDAPSHWRESHQLAEAGPSPNWKVR